MAQSGNAHFVDIGCRDIFHNLNNRQDSLVLTHESKISTLRSGIHKSKARQHQLDGPVGIGSFKKCSFKVAMALNIAVLDQNTSGISHITRGRSRILLVVVVVLE
jgi:hypothetical protein